MKAVLISIQPKWCELIANGKKTIEVRKAAPKLDTPFKAYIYCTKPRKFIHGYPDGELFRHIDGRIECGFSFQITTERGVFTKDNFLSGKVVGEFVCDRISKYPFDWVTFTAYGTELFTINDNELELTCLSRDEFNRYGADSNKHKGYLYGWHISNLKIYDKPKELWEFSMRCKVSCANCKNPAYYNPFIVPGCEEKGVKKVLRAPQSWCCVEDNYDRRKL